MDLPCDVVETVLCHAIRDGTFVSTHALRGVGRAWDRTLLRVYVDPRLEEVRAYLCSMRSTSLSRRYLFRVLAQRERSREEEGEGNNYNEGIGDAEVPPWWIQCDPARCVGRTRTGHQCMRRASSDPLHMCAQHRRRVPFATISFPSGR